MKKIKLCLVGLIIVVVFTQVVVTSSDVPSYDLMADVNRDSVVDVNDLARLGRVYGSSLVLPSIPNKTVVTVLSFDKEPPEVENATIVIFDPELFSEWYGFPIDVQHANSSGIATFELGLNKNYTALAWKGSSYNFANLTTNSLGEASVLILLGEPVLPPIKALPNGWVVVTVLEEGTSALYSEVFGVMFYNLTWNGLGGPVGIWSGEEVLSLASEDSVFVLLSDLRTNKPFSRIGLGCFDEQGRTIGDSVYSPDENGCANVVVYVTPP